MTSREYPDISFSVGRDIDRIPLPTHAAHGALWLCGKHAIGPDPDELVERVGADTVVCLVESHEIRARYPDYCDWLRRHEGTRAHWRPIPDLGALPDPAMAGLVDDVVALITTGRHLIVHCGAGIGRAGTIACGVLIRLGMGLDDALGHVRSHRRLAGPEAGAQQQFLEHLAQA